MVTGFILYMESFQKYMNGKLEIFDLKFGEIVTPLNTMEIRLEKLEWVIRTKWTNLKTG
jgi:hypothetical protein